MSGAHRLERLTFEVHRAAEYVSIKELQVQTGAAVGQFGELATKELFDNGLDACEEAGVVPHITVDVAWRADGGAVLRVRDNGPGLKPEVVGRILDFNSRTSSKVLYRSPTRGSLGNALKAIVGMPTALGSQEPIIIEAQGVRHTITVRVDPAGRVHVQHDQDAVGPTTGTCVAVVLPAAAWTHSNPAGVCYGAALVNPHALVHFRPSVQTPAVNTDGRSMRPELYTPRVAQGGAGGPSWRKWLPSDPTSPHWYDVQSFERLIYGHIALAQAGGRDKPLGEFVREFRGCKRTAVARGVCAAVFGLSHLSALEGKPALIASLLTRMRALAGAPPKPEVLGLVGKEPLRALLSVSSERFWYEKALWLTDDGIPWAAEVAIAVDPRRSRAARWCGLNFSYTLGDPLAGVTLVPTQESVRSPSTGLSTLLDTLHVVGAHAPATTATVLHLVSPSMEHLDRGKSRLRVDAHSAEQIATLVARAARDLHKEGEKNRARSYGGAVRESRPRQTGMTFKQAFPQVIDEAYAEAIGHSSTVEARTVAYAVRPRLQALCPGRPMGKRFLDYITQQLIPDYRQAHPGALPGVDYEPRGRLIEPHTRREIRLGTREVAAYTVPRHHFNKILLVEKRGRTLVLVEAGLAEKYDMAIGDTEGYASTACRQLLERCSKEEHYQIYIVHDADWHGYGIARTLREETRRMPGYSVDVIDLGLFFEDAVRSVDDGGYGLQTEARDRVYDLPADLELTPAERAAFTGVRTNRKDKAGRTIWEATCVEINAFPNDAFIAMVDSQLQRKGAAGKVIPPGAVLVEHYLESWEQSRRTQIEERLLAEVQQRIDQQIAQLLAAQNFADPEVLRALRDQLTQDVPAALQSDPLTHWRAVVEEMAAESDNEEEDTDEQED